MPIRGFQSAGVVACFDEPNQTGAIGDLNAPRNAPAKSPQDHLDKMIFHSALFQYEIVAGTTDVTVNHTALAGKTTTWALPAGGMWGPGAPPPNSITFVTIGDTRQTDIQIFNHGLGYIPKFMVSLDGRRLPDGYMVQLQGGGEYRRVSAWANASSIFLRESAVSSNAALSGVSRTYKVMVFANRAPNPSRPLFGKEGARLTLARGIIDSGNKYLRRTGVGDTPFALNLGPTIDIRNGGSRTASGGVVVSEPRYNGSMVAPPFTSVGVD
jgi:hypothetical protein